MQSDISQSNKIGHGNIRKDSVQVAGYTSLIGPVSLLATCGVYSSVAYQGHLSFPLLALIGLCLCWKLGWTGFWSSLLVIVAAALYYIPGQSGASTLVDAAFAASTLIGLLITTLSDESEAEPALEVVKAPAPAPEPAPLLAPQFSPYAAELATKNQKLDQIVKEKQALLQEIELHKEEQEKLRKELLGIKRSESKAQERLSEAKSETEIQRKRAQEEKDALRRNIEALEASLAKAKEELAVPKPVVEAPKPELSPDREVRRLEGMYRQLQTQFAEKSAQLDAARKEIFHVSERCEALSRDAEERAIDRSRGDAEMERQLARLEQESRQTISRLEAEVASLEEVIARMS